MDPPSRLLPSNNNNSVESHETTLNSCIGLVEQRNYSSRVITKPQQRPRRPSTSIVSSSSFNSNNDPPTSKLLHTPNYKQKNKATLFLDILTNTRRLKDKYSLFLTNDAQKLTHFASTVLSILQNEFWADAIKRQEISALLFPHSPKNANLISVELYDELVRAANDVSELEDNGNNMEENFKEITTQYDTDSGSPSSGSLPSSTASNECSFGGKGIPNTSIGGGDIRESYPIPSASFLSENGEIKTFYPVSVGDSDDENDNEYYDDYAPFYESDDDEDPLMI